MEIVHGKRSAESEQNGSNINDKAKKKQKLGKFTQFALDDPV